MTLTDATREYVVRGAHIRKEKRGSLGFPKQAFEEGQEPNEVWLVQLRIQEGLLPETSILAWFRSELEASEYISNHPVGSEFVCSFTSKFLERIDFDEWIKMGWFPIKAGGPNSFTIFDTLKSAGITDELGVNTSQHILDALGYEKIQDLIEKYGENWQVVARYQYCVQTLPHSSPAYIAAAHDLCYYILDDAFKAGYLLRDLEVLLHGVEETAARAIATRQKAGQSGSRKSAQAREKRRAALFEKIVTLVERNPDLPKLASADVVAKMALQACIKDSAAMWRQGKGQITEYLGEIRRGEAGPDMQERYRALFGS